MVVPDDTGDPETLLYQALASLEGVAEFRRFFRDLCTPTELEALVDRWRVVPLLARGMSYREIHDHTGVSVTTIGRVARYFTMGNGGYALAAERTVKGRKTRTAANGADSRERRS